ncbi:MAG: DEAD/DEAH box helicase [Acidithiobacillus sp.]|jgi:replicative superfamily II helicase|uniref:DEAD/DEAH box helicase n=1 Tax=Acidithiobacillus sp. TaxID=1872118 RepID=UPI00355F26DB
MVKKINLINLIEGLNIQQSTDQIISKKEDNEYITDIEEKEEKEEIVLQKKTSKFDLNEIVKKITFHTEQIEAFKRIEEGINLSLVWATGKGKTLPAQFLANKCVKNNKTFTIVGPLKALAHEQDDTFGQFFNTLILTGDYQQNKLKMKRSDVEGYTMTLEMLYQFAILPDRHWFFQQLGGCIYDEAHMVGDKSRGWKIETAWYILKRLFPKIQMLKLSATIGNYKEFAEHFNDQLIYSPDRAIPLETHVIPEPRKFYKKDKLIQYQKDVDFLIKKHGQVPMLIFCTARSTCMELKNYTEQKYPILKCAVHNAGELTKNREQIEASFRDGSIDIIFCTTTLSMGINMPTVVCALMGLTFYDPNKSKEVLMNFSQMIQIIGRSGRKGMPIGYAYIFADDRKLEHFNYKSLAEIVEENVNKPMVVQSRVIPLNPIDYLNGGILGDQNYLDVSFLGLISSGLNKTSDLEDFYWNLFRTHEDLEKNSYLIENTINWLIHNQFICENEDKNGYELLELGYHVVETSIMPKTALHFVNLKNVFEKMPNEPSNYFDLWVLLHTNEEYLDNINVAKSNEQDQIALQIAEQYISKDRLDPYINDNEYFMELLEKKWECIKKAFGMCHNAYLNHYFNSFELKYAGDVKLLSEASKRIIFSSNKIFTKSDKYYDHFVNIFNGQSNTTKDGKYTISYPIIHKEILELMSINGVGFKKAISLYFAGIKSIVHLKNANFKDIEEKTQELRNTNRDLFVTISEDALKNIQLKIE